MKTKTAKEIRFEKYPAVRIDFAGKNQLVMLESDAIKLAKEYHALFPVRPLTEDQIHDWFCDNSDEIHDEEFNRAEDALIKFQLHLSNIHILNGASIREMTEDELHQFVINWLGNYTPLAMNVNALDGFAELLQSHLLSHEGKEEQLKKATYEAEYQLQEFRDVQKEHFDEDGKCWTGNHPANHIYIMEQMLNLINILEKKHENTNC